MKIRAIAKRSGDDDDDDEPSRSEPLQFTEKEREALFAASRDSDANVRNSALGLLADGAIDHNDVLVRFREALHDKEKIIRHQAMWILSDVDPKNAELMTQLQELVKSEEEYDVRLAIDCLSSRAKQNGKAIEMLVAQFEDPSWGVSSIERSRISNRVTRKTGGVRVHAIETLSKLGRRATAATDALERELRHSDPDVRKAAADALFQITGKRTDAKGQPAPSQAQDQSNHNQ